MWTDYMGRGARREDGLGVVAESFSRCLVATVNLREAYGAPRRERNFELTALEAAKAWVDAQLAALTAAPLPPQPIEIAWRGEADVVAQIHARGLAICVAFHPGYAFGVVPSVQGYETRWIDTSTGDHVDRDDVAYRLGLPKDGTVPQLMHRLPVTAVDIVAAREARSWLDTVSRAHPLTS